MAFGSEMHDRARPMACKEAVDERPIADVTAHENVVGLAVKAAQVLEVAGIGQGVQVDHGSAAVGQPIQHEIAANKSGAAGNQNHCASPLVCPEELSPQL